MIFEALHYLNELFQSHTNNSLLLLDEFLGDIAIPLNEEPLAKLKIPNLQEEIEKYKQEVLEGLQIEEEGLTDYFRKKTKQNSPLNNTEKYNDPTGHISINQNGHKNGQSLNLKPNKPFQKLEDTTKLVEYSSIKPEIENLNSNNSNIVKNAGKNSANRRKRHESGRKSKTK